MSITILLGSLFQSDFENDKKVAADQEAKLEAPDFRHYIH